MRNDTFTWGLLEIRDPSQALLVRILKFRVLYQADHFLQFPRTPKPKSPAGRSAIVSVGEAVFGLNAREEVGQEQVEEAPFLSLGFRV